MRAIKTIAIPIVTVIFILMLNRPVFNLPPLGGFLNPTTGAWKNADIKPQTRLVIHEELLQDSVQVQYDASMVPHIIAKNEHDLYFVQGYVTARERLWQMDIQARKAMGRLSEVFGGNTVQQDIYFRRLQLYAAAEKSLELINSDCQVKQMLEAYSEGVNAWIEQLKPANLPLEYKLFDHRPEKWKPLYSVLIMKLMAETLAGGSDDFEMSQVLEQFGHATTSDLFPAYPYKEDPVIPAGTPWNFSAPAPPANKPSNVQLGSLQSPEHAKRSEGIGSNNWALSGKKTRSGFPLLANDPHLKLTLPSIWYQAQLMAPGQNVYGVSIPGVPALVIGFNSNIAWGVTNVYADVMDWYRIEFRDASCKEYSYEGRWVPAREKTEVIRIRGGGSIQEKVVLTHYGPVMQNKLQQGDKAKYALKWIGHEASQEIASLYYVNKAADYASFRHALTYFTAPAQNFVYADKYQHIAMVSAGRYPLKSREQGKYVMDGGMPGNEWKGWIPNGENPAMIDPARNFVSSANQSLTDSSYPHYINWQFSPSERARRINARLGRMDQVTADSLRLLQNDKYSMVAEDVLPFLLSKVPLDKCTQPQQQAWKLLQGWDKNLYSSSAAATMFNAWWGSLYENIWADDFTIATGSLQKPNRDRTIKLLLEEINSPWFDDKRTPAVEHADDIILKSFQYTTDSLVKHFGAPGKGWEWGRHKASIIEHVGRVGSFGTGFFSSEGSGSTVDAVSRTTGPSWRMIVELGEDVHAFGILPGGQSGNPGSYYYDNLLGDWKSGRLQPLHFLRHPKDSLPQTGAVILFNH